jgi:hypothetical protein
MQELKDFKNWNYSNIKNILYKETLEGLFSYHKSCDKDVGWYSHNHEVFDVHNSEIHIIYKNNEPSEYFNETHLNSMVSIDWYEDNFNCNMFELYNAIKNSFLNFKNNKETSLIENIRDLINKNELSETLKDLLIDDGIYYYDSLYDYLDEDLRIDIDYVLNLGNELGKNRNKYKHFLNYDNKLFYFKTETDLMYHLWILYNTSNEDD